MQDSAYDPLEVCDGVCVCRDPSLCLYFHIFLFVCFSVFGTFAAVSDSRETQLIVGTNSIQQA